MKAGAMDETARALRRDFDAGFASAPPEAGGRLEDFLTIGVAGDPYALDLAHIGSLHRDWRIVPIVSHAPELLGVSGNRGAIIPVYDLGALLGYAREPAPRWVVTARSAAVALGFARFHGHVRVAPEAVLASENTSAFVDRTLEYKGARHPVVNVSAVVDVIARRGQPVAPAKER
jgi:chemotaxis signal transduction protein